MEGIIALSIPIAICVVLPVMVVWLTTRSKNHLIDKKTEVLLKAIENGQEVDPELFAEPKANRKGSTKKLLLNRLQNGVLFSILGIFLILSVLFDCTIMTNEIQVFIAGASLAVGVACFVAYFVGRKMLAAEIQAEEENAKESVKSAGNANCR